VPRQVNAATLARWACNSRDSTRLPGVVAAFMREDLGGGPELVPEADDGSSSSSSGPELVPEADDDDDPATELAVVRAPIMALVDRYAQASCDAALFRAGVAQLTPADMLPTLDAYGRLCVAADRTRAELAERLSETATLRRAH
jgi:hypothetical protein